MKTKLTILILLFSSLLTAQSNVLQLMINTEYAFAAKAAEVGTRNAFLEFIADDGILFRPHPQNGKKFLEASKPRSGILMWYPSFAILSQSEDLGFSTGPWSFKKQATDTTESAYGNFATIWERQEDGSFKFAIDYGISHDKPTSVEKSLSKTDTRINSQNSSFESEVSNKILDIDRTANFRISKDGLIKYLSELSQLLVEGSHPFTGRQQILDYIKNNSYTDFNYKPEGGKISKAEDLAFSYGELTFKKKNENADSKLYYMRVWSKQDNTWKILSETWNK